MQLSEVRRCAAELNLKLLPVQRGVIRKQANEQHRESLK